MFKGSKKSERSSERNYPMKLLNLKMTVFKGSEELSQENKYSRTRFRGQSSNYYNYMLSRLVKPNSFVTSWTVARQGPLFVGFSRQEFWSGFPFPPAGNLPDSESNPRLLHPLHCRRILHRGAIGKPLIPISIRSLSVNIF